MNSGDGVMRVRCDCEPNNAIVVRWKYLVHVGWIRTVEEEQKATVVARPTPIKLNHEPVGLLPRNEIIVDSNPLARNEFVGSQVDPTTQSNLK